MTPFELRRALSRLTYIIDTREQDTPALRERIAALGAPHRRAALSYGDYSAETTDDAGNTISLERRAVVERKMSADELCQCFASGRDRFKREFERAQADGARVWLLCEDATWEQLYNGKYRSKLSAKALVASILSWSAKHNLHIVFCRKETSAWLIRDILHYEMRTHLEGMGNDRTNQADLS